MTAQLFVSSFSENPDVLSQWRAYTHGGAGVSVGFETRYLLSRARPQHFRLIRCIYDPKVQSRIMRELIERANREYKRAGFEYSALRYFMHLVNLAAAFKHPSYREEQEWRLVSDFRYSPPFEKGFSNKWRASQSMLIPYTDFKLSNKHGQIEMADIYVGPTPHLDLSMDSVHDVVSSEVSGRRMVNRSSVPYRNW